MNTLARTESGTSRRGRSRERSFDNSDGSFESWESASSSDDDDTYEPESNPNIAYKASTEYESDHGTESYVSDSEPQTPMSTDFSEYDSESLPESTNIVSMDSMRSPSQDSDDESDYAEDTSIPSEGSFEEATSVPSEGSFEVDDDSENDEADELSFGEFDTEDDKFQNTKSFADDDDESDSDSDSDSDGGEEEEVKLGQTDDDLFWKRYGYSQNVGGTFGDESKTTAPVDEGDEETETSNRSGSGNTSDFDDGDTFKDELYTQAFPSIARMRTEDSRETIEDPERSFNNHNQDEGMFDKAKNWLFSNVENLKSKYNDQRAESPRRNSWFDFSDVLKGNFKWYILGVILIILIAIIAGTTSKKRKRNAIVKPIIQPTMPPTLFPTAFPTAAPTAAPTLPPGQVLERITFFLLVPNGTEIGITEMDMEFDMIAIFDVLAPQVLFNTTTNTTANKEADRISLNTVGLRGRQRQRALKALSLNSTSINTTTIDCPDLSSITELDLCFRTTADIAVMTDDGSIGFDYAAAMKDAIDSGSIQTVSDEYNLNLTITILDVEDVVTASPTAAPVCEDTDISCPIWASQNPSECDVNPDYMLTYCAKSCDACPTPSPTTMPSAAPTMSPTEKTTSAPTSNPTAAPPTMVPTIATNTTTAPTTTPVQCFDKNEACAESMGGNCLFTKCALWAQEGECIANPTYMWSNCARSCDQCGSEPTPTASPTPSNDSGTGPASPTQAPVIAGCVDSNPECPQWASQDQCTANPNWMLANCRLSCNNCESNVDPSCVDSNTECPGWAAAGECTNNPVWMMENCQKSCNSCQGGNDNNDTTDDVYDNDDATECLDNNDRCAEWAADAQCESNPSWMLVNCQLSCNVCGDGEIDRDRPPDDSDSPPT